MWNKCKRAEKILKELFGSITGGVNASDEGLAVNLNNAHNLSKCLAVFRFILHNFIN
jgi:hypothetical protein